MHLPVCSLGHLFSVYTQKEEGAKQNACVMHPRRRGGGLMHLSIYTISPFLHVFVMFSYAWYFWHTLLSLVTTIITVLQNI